MFMYDIWYDRCMHMFDCLVKPASKTKTLMFGATGPTLKVFNAISNHQFSKNETRRFRFQHCNPGTLFFVGWRCQFIPWCMYQRHGITWFLKVLHGRTSSRVVKKFHASAGWGFTWVPWFFMLSGFVLFSAYLKNPKDGRHWSRGWSSSCDMWVVSCEVDGSCEVGRDLDSFL